MQYEGVIAEVKAVRGGVGIFDVSHMGRLSIHGSGAASVHGQPGDVQRDDAGDGAGALRLHAVRQRRHPGRRDPVPHAVRGRQRHAAPGLQRGQPRGGEGRGWRSSRRRSAASRSSTTRRTPCWWRCRVRGALDIVDRLCPDEPKPSALRPFGAAPFPLSLGGSAVAEGFIGRTGYTGEDGVEVAMEAAYGARPVGGAGRRWGNAVRARRAGRAAAGGRAAAARLRHGPDDDAAGGVARAVRQHGQGHLPRARRAGAAGGGRPAAQARRLPDARRGRAAARVRGAARR